MRHFKIYYENGIEMRQNDLVVVNGKIKGRIESVLEPGTKEAVKYSHEEGGFVLSLENGDLQVWTDTDEDIQLIKRGE